MELETISSLGRLEQIRTKWSDLLHHCPGATPFQHPDWVISWWRVYQPGEPCVVALWQRGQLAGVAPLLFWNRYGRRMLGFCAGGFSDYADAIVDPRHCDCAIRLLQRWIDSQEWDVCDLEPVPEGSRVLEMDFGAVEPRDVCPVLDLPPSADKLPEVVPKRQLSNLRKYRRKAPYESDREDWREGLEALLRMHATRWHGEFGTADRQSAEFVRRVAEAFAERDELRMHSVRLEGRILAAALAFELAGQTFLYRLGYDPEFAKLSPGVVAVGDCIEQAVERGMRRFDFLRGAEPYKYWWGARDRRTMRLRRDRTVSANRRQCVCRVAYEPDSEWSPAGLAVE